MNTAKRYNRDEAFAKAIKAAFELDDETKLLIRQANWDLYYGPNGGGLDDEDGECAADDACEDPSTCTHKDRAYPGFSTACKLISDGLDDANVSDVYYDDNADYVETSEPDYCEGNCGDEDCCKPLPSDYTHYDRSDVIRILVGPELAKYVQ